jgi:hypothetical protein
VAGSIIVILIPSIAHLFLLSASPVAINTKQLKDLPFTPEKDQE